MHPYVLVVEEPTKGFGSRPYSLLPNHQDRWRGTLYDAQREEITNFPEQST